MTAIVMTIVGARPQFVKAGPVSRAIAARAGLAERLIHTGQHFDANMSDVFFEELAIRPPDRHLDIHGGPHGEMTGRMLEALEAEMQASAPAMVLIYGDTNSTLAGALAAAKLHIPVAHVEAGLRSFDRRMPEEVNRVVADHVSDLLLCPTRAAVENLAREGITEGVHHTGDVMLDATRDAAARARESSTILDDLGLEEGGFTLATVHRASNTDDPAALAAVVAWLKERAQERPLVLPIHPRTRAAVARDGLDLAPIRVIDPAGYLDMARLLDAAAEVYTDSGGVQKEAYFHRTPCVTLRDATEWVETVEAGWNRLWTTPDYAPRRDIPEYGDGRAAEAIVDVIADRLARRAG